MEAEYNNLFYADFFRKRIQELKPDVVHFYHLQRLSASAIDVCREMGIPMVFTATDFWLICPTNQLLLPDYSAMLGSRQRTGKLRSASCGHFPGERGTIDTGTGTRPVDGRPDPVDRGTGLPVRKTLCPPCACPGRQTCVHGKADEPDRHGAGGHPVHGGDAAPVMAWNQRGFAMFLLESTTPTSHAFRQKERRRHLRIGFIGTLYHHKGAHVLLEAVRSLPTEMPLKVKIYGDLEQFPEYARLLRSLAGDDRRIEFCGTFANSSIGEIFCDLDVLVIPSLWYENSPLTLSFAQAARVPVVATNSEGMK